MARYVQKDDAQPQILLLKPNPAIADEFECLYDVPLPFAEDVRSYQFPPLDKVLTVTGGVLKEHRLLPSDDLKEAMSDFVDAMDLSSAGVDDEGYVVAVVLNRHGVNISAGNRQSMRLSMRRTIQQFTASIKPSAPVP